MTTMHDTERVPYDADDKPRKGRMGITILGLIIVVLAIIGLLAIL